jgi:phage baseplate assembly protein gpV
LKKAAFASYLTVAVSLCLAAFFVACGSSKSAAPTGSIAAPSTTLEAETGNNTSTADSFTRETNGNTGPGNVSKLPINSLLYSGSTTKIYATWLGWFGMTNHMSVGYNSNTAAQVHAQVADMISRGMQGAIADWYGTGSTNINAATTLLRNEAEAHPGKFEFAIMEDKGALASAAKSNGCDVTDQLISDMTYIASQYESSPAYMRVNGRPVVFFFDVDAYYIDWNRVISSIPGNPLLISRGINGLTGNLSDGGYSWVNIHSNNPFDPELNGQDSFFQAAQQVPQRLVIGTAYKGFNDTLATWGTNRVIDQNCGQTWLQSFHEVGKFYSTGAQLPDLQIATWNDYEEGTAIETGIDNCVYLIPSQSGSTINWSVNGNENTIDHYTVFISTDGTNLSPLIDIPRGTHAVDLSQLNLSPTTTYSVFVKAVGLPSIQNKMSPAIAYHAGDQPPAVSLNVSPGGSLTYTASASLSSGNVGKSVIDFGDGTVVSGASASHTYKVVGTYLITATVYDSAGASSVDVKQISAKAPSSGVTIFSPASNSIVNWPTALMASANPGTPVSEMRVLIDGQQAYATHGDTLNTALKIFTGAHQLSVESLDASGNPTATASFNVVAEPADIPPVANITVTPLPNISPTTVLGCTAASTDPDGFLNSHKLQYSDGSHFSIPAAVETFAAPGTYTAIATVTDQFGATSTTSTTFSVAGGSVSGVTTSAAQGEIGQQAKKVIEPIQAPQ